MALAALLARPASSVTWSPLQCPHAGRPFEACSEPAPASDVAVTLFFQIESTGGSGGAFSCATDANKAVLCSRNWTQPESGSVGSCFFLLPAGQGYSCSAVGGQVNVIDADSTPLASGTLSPESPVASSCPGTRTLDVAGASSCTAPAQPRDTWVAAAWTAAASPAGAAAFECSVDGVVVCAYAAAATGAADASSCTFLVPAQAELSCRATGGATTFSGSSVVAAFSAPYAAAGLPPAGVACPPAHVNKTNDCDCTYDAPPTEDVLVQIVSTSIDAGFNSFHCFMAGANVCGWGSNIGMNNSLGSCTFLVPAGSEYGCSMEWGAASFPFTSVSLMSRGVFPAGGAVYSSASLFPRAPAPFAGDAARVERLWREWREGRPEYASAEEAAQRRANFALHVASADNVAHKIRDHPYLDEQGRQNRFNHFADWTRGEWERVHRQRRRLGRQPELSELARADIPPPPPAPPAPFDWAQKGVVTPVKDQGQCGSCWSFSTTGSVESAWAVAGNPLVSLSEQYLVSCDTTSDGCDGGWPYSAMDFLASTGAITEASYPYESGNGSSLPCESNGRVHAAANATGFQAVAGNTSAAREEALADWLAAYSPVSILVDDMTTLWWSYVGGIMTACCDVATNHAVLLTGYDNNATSNLSYWKIKNSWSAEWGVSGYVWLARGSNECGIGSFPTIASVQGGKMPSPPPPPPTPPPPMPPYECPADAFSVNTTTTARCEWRNGTHSGLMPSSIGEYCDYFADGYFGYTFDGKLSENAYPCWPSFTAAGDGGAVWFCTLTAHSGSFNAWPASAKADCSKLNEGVIAYEWPVSLV